MIYILTVFLVFAILVAITYINRPSNLVYVQGGGQSKKSGKGKNKKGGKSKENNTTTTPKSTNKNGLISGIKFTSNSDKINLNDDYGSKFAELNSKKSWASNPQARYLSYLEATLPNYYQIDGIITKGRDGSREWVTRYYVEYWDKYKDNWVKYPQILNGNRNDTGAVTNGVNIKTDKIRIYPVKWNRHPSLRIGFIGNKTSFSRCRYYREKMRHGNNMDRKNYQRLYQKHCLKVPKETFDMVVDNLRKNKKAMCQNRDKMKKLEERERELRKLKRHCCLVANELKQLKNTSCPREQLVDLAQKYRAIVEKRRALSSNDK